MPAPAAERSLNVPNAITLARFLLSFVLFALIQTGDCWLWAAGLFVFAVATVMFIVGIAYFEKVERRFADVI